MEILGRRENEGSTAAEARASVVAGPQMEIPYVSGAQGTAVVRAYFSQDDEDRGGVVLRFTAEKTDCSFIPAVREVENGVELHLAGDAEAASFISALKGVLASMPSPTRYPGNRW